LLEPLASAGRSVIMTTDGFLIKEEGLMEQDEYNPFGSVMNKVGRGSSTERDRAEHEAPSKQPSMSVPASRRSPRKANRSK
jgi:hypothetical protein